MKQAVSKVRARKTRTREKMASRPAGHRFTWAENPLVGLVLAVGLWAATVFLLGIEDFVRRPPETAFIFTLAGEATFLIVALFATAVFLQILDPGILRRNAKVGLLAAVSLVSVLPAKAIFYAAETTGLVRPEIAPFLLPVTLAPMLATILLSGPIGIAVGSWTSLVLAIFAGRSFSLFIGALLVTVVAANLSSRVRRRSQVVKIGLITGIIEVMPVLGLTLLQWQNSDVTVVLRQAGACVTSGVVSAMLVLLILPLFELLFGITSNITLLELSDLGHPLLQRLAIEAPGTYHHSLVVANLAQAAADDIGANSLLARVCAYFHDVGKLTKPEFFTENIKMRNNPHDDLPPSMSTLVITAHVKEGLSLALLHKLPPPVRNVIREHHGTSVLSYFHHKAKTQQEAAAAGSEAPTRPNGRNAPTPDDRDFRYQGPKPSSRESGIICLADAVEAASRAMEKTTPVHIENLVRDIINSRLADGQLDQCALTFAEVARIRRSFVFTLTNMYHGRVPYPTDEDRDKQPAEPGPRKPAEATEPGAPPDGSVRRS